MTKLLLTSLLILSPMTTLSARKMKKQFRPSKRMMQRQEHRRQFKQMEEEKNVTLCTPKVIETGGTIVIATLRVVAVILSIFIR